jgi:hypothetical protein
LLDDVGFVWEVDRACSRELKDAVLEASGLGKETSFGFAISATNLGTSSGMPSMERPVATAEVDETSADAASAVSVDCLPRLVQGIYWVPSYVLQTSLIP